MEANLELEPPKKHVGVKIGAWSWSCRILVVEPEKEPLRRTALQSLFRWEQHNLSKELFLICLVRAG